MKNRSKMKIFLMEKKRSLTCMLRPLTIWPSIAWMARRASDCLDENRIDTILDVLKFLTCRMSQNRSHAIDHFSVEFQRRKLARTPNGNRSRWKSTFFFRKVLRQIFFPIRSLTKNKECWKPKVAWAMNVISKNNQRKEFRFLLQSIQHENYLNWWW